MLAQLEGHGDAVQAPDGPEVLQHLAADVLGEPPAELHQVGLREYRPDGRTRELSTRAFYTEYTLTSKLTPEYLLVSNAKKKYVSLSKYFLTWMAVMLLQEDWHDVRVPVDEGGDEMDLEI